MGAQFFSLEIPKIICSLDQNVKEKININHQVVSSELKNVKELYSKHKIKSNVKKFFQNIIKCYKSADLIISRSGGSTLAEILNLQIPSIIIPLQNSMDNHQKINSNVITENSLGWVFDEDEIKNDNFKILLNKLILRKKINNDIFKNYKLFKNNFPTSFKKLPHEIISQKISNVLNIKIQNFNRPKI